MPVQHPKFRCRRAGGADVSRLRQGVDLIAEAARNDAKLIAFPETRLPGYPWFIWLDSPAWGRQFVQRYHDNSLVYGSTQADRLARAAKDSAELDADLPLSLLAQAEERQGRDNDDDGADEPNDAVHDPMPSRVMIKMCPDCAEVVRMSASR